MYQFNIGRRYHNHRQQTYMFRKAAVILLISFKELAVVPFLCAIYFFLFFAFIKLALYHKHIFFVKYVLVIERIEKAFTKRQVMNSIEQIGFACTIMPHKAVNVCRKLQVYLTVILKIKDG